MKYLLCVLTLSISFNGLATLSQEEFDQSQASTIPIVYRVMVKIWMAMVR